MANQLKDCNKCKKQPTIIHEGVYRITCFNCGLVSKKADTLEGVISHWRYVQSMAWMQSAIGRTFQEIFDRGHKSDCQHKKPLSVKGFWGCNCGFDNWYEEYKDAFDVILAVDRWWGVKYARD